MGTYFVHSESVSETSSDAFVGCVHHGMNLQLEENSAKLLVHFGCSLAEFPPLAMLIYERARELECVFKVPFGYSEMIRYFHLTPFQKKTIFRVDFFKKDSGPIGLPQNYHSWRAKWFATSGNWDKVMPGLIPTERRGQVSALERCIPRNRNAKLNLRFYVEGIDPKWKKMQRPWSAIRSYYGKVKDDASDDMEGREDDSDAAESCEFENADEPEKRQAEVKGAMLQGVLSVHDVMQTLQFGLVKNDAAHAYLTSLEAKVVSEELIRPDLAPSASKLRRKRRNDPVVTGTSSSSVTRAGDARTAAMESRAVVIARLQADLAREKAKGKRSAK